MIHCEGLYNEQKPLPTATHTFNLISTTTYRHIEGGRYEFNTQCHTKTASISPMHNLSTNCDTLIRAKTRIVDETMMVIDGYGRKSATIRIPFVL